MCIWPLDGGDGVILIYPLFYRLLINIHLRVSLTGYIYSTYRNSVKLTIIEGVRKLKKVSYFEP